MAEKERGRQDAAAKDETQQDLHAELLVDAYILLQGEVDCDGDCLPSQSNGASLGPKECLTSKGETASEQSCGCECKVEEKDSFTEHDALTAGREMTSEISRESLVAFIFEGENDLLTRREMESRLGSNASVSSVSNVPRLGADGSTAVKLALSLEMSESMKFDQRQSSSSALQGHPSSLLESVDHPKDTEDEDHTNDQVRQQSTFVPHASMEETEVAPRKEPSNSDLMKVIAQRSALASMGDSMKESYRHLKTDNDDETKTFHHSSGRLPNEQYYASESTDTLKTTSTNGCPKKPDDSWQEVAANKAAVRQAIAEEESAIESMTRGIVAAAETNASTEFSESELVDSGVSTSFARLCVALPLPQQQQEVNHDLAGRRRSTAINIFDCTALTRGSRIPSPVGAFAVGGISTTRDNGDARSSFLSTGDVSERPVALLEATLVEHPDTVPELVEAQPMHDIGGAYLIPSDLEASRARIGSSQGSHACRSETGQEIAQSTRTWKLITGFLCLFLMAGVLVVTIAFVVSSRQQQQDLDGSVGKPNEVDLDIQKNPFTEHLQQETIRQIKMYPNSPQAMANQWMYYDPSLDDFPLHRQMNRFALATFYYSTGGNNGAWFRNDHWLDYHVSECDWYSSHPGPICDYLGNFIILNLTKNALGGEMTDVDFQYLSQLQVLDVSHNQIKGAHPYRLPDSLEVLDYSHNQIGGTPTIEANWIAVNLRVLRLNDNLLSGPLPWTGAMLFPILEIVDGSMNLLTGTFPDIPFGKITESLKYFNMSHNHLTGTFPSKTGSFRALEVFDFSYNQGMRGEIPPNYAEFSNLKYLGIVGTGLAGTIPEGLCAMVNPPPQFDELQEVQEHTVRLHIDANCEVLECC